MPIAPSLLRLLSKSFQRRTNRGMNVLLKADSAFLGGGRSLICRHRVRSFHVLLSVGRSRRIESGHTASRRSSRKTVKTRTQAGESGKTPSSAGGRSGSFGRGRPDVSDVSADQNPPASVPQRPRARRPWLGCPAPVRPDASIAMIGGPKVSPASVVEPACAGSGAAAAAPPIAAAIRLWDGVWP